ncbi:MAG: hypothetical protein COW66_04850 [Flavobacteriaceae bacterium CG18_big_fil_WC_8_21_14_2_50_34_36]|nr:tetratricopeptide repeat protein [Flavobacteriia bacterium]PIQ18752.1 MAG: hypothetical protein COW66_04850 [Flavobacteriaceae bacterium CG18_big_fil_WC_8_21_14_2_50_34_36]PIV48341.1 MAG: hypothetical protein COS19_14205 [Flavobacteriaceae bacterium CG02_land_8_20_14_3_00_34_13]PIZ07268.1 MAG: hypothetical protein COY56_09925 [Flavobacteriaceae bacterium CG_4_10_14_0_8_um_filter_34_31]PJC08191.1 MAG: hypothetical protein CO068_02260 [Flavobacteriaceae bacterium CG_4_9_14_0_8_um_filter_34_30]
MKKRIVLITLLFITVIAFPQKKELREASKAIKEGSFADAKATLAQLEGTISSADQTVQAEYYLYKGEAFLGIAGKNEKDLITAADSFKKVIALEEDSGKSKYTEQAEKGMQNLRVRLVNAAIEDQNAERYAEASKKLYTSYTISPKDTSDLYYAAGNALNAKEYTSALDYFQTLLDLGFTGVQKEYNLIDKTTQEVATFYSKEERDLMMLSGNYIKPTEKLSKSKKGEVLRNVAFLLIDKGDTDKAKLMIAEARKENPDDDSLLRAEAGIALKLNDMKTYSKLMQEIIATDPNNPELYYNLGVSSASIGDKENAEKYYLKALELDPEYQNAKVNMAALILEDETKIIEEMNALGTSAKDNKRYDELKGVREGLFKKAVPYLESALESRPDNIQITRTLMNIYTILGEDAKFKQMKQKLEEIEN